NHAACHPSSSASHPPLSISSTSSPISSTKALISSFSSILLLSSLIVLLPSLKFFLRPFILLHRLPHQFPPPLQFSPLSLHQTDGTSSIGCGEGETNDTSIVSRQRSNSICKRLVNLIHFARVPISIRQ
ncbi:hypothetical protein LINGRAHAP2_LOCUS5145, partial [Linum grandiflorum]